MYLSPRHHAATASPSRLLPVLAAALLVSAACGGAKDQAAMSAAADTAAVTAAPPAAAAAASTMPAAPAGNTGSSVRKNEATKPKAAVKLTLASGTRIPVTIRDSITSRHDTTGTVISAVVASDVKDAKGNVVIPAGSPVAMHIAVITASKAGDTKGEGRLELSITSVTVGKTAEPLDVSITDVPHKMVGRGITKGQATDVAVGTAVGALAGQLIGKNTKSTVIGGSVGAVAGGVVAVKGAQSDLVVAAGTEVSFALPRALTYTP